MKFFAVVFLGFVCSVAWANDTRPIKRGPAAQESLPPQPEKTDGTVPVEVTETPSSTPVLSPPMAAADADGDVAAKWAVTGNFSYLDIWVPAKFGVAASYRFSPKHLIEFEYLRGSFGGALFGFDLGRIVEQRAALVWRKFPSGRAYNYFLGANFNDLEVTIGDSALATISSGNLSDYELMKFSTLGLSAGLGHRWQWPSGFVLAIDWIHVHMPLVTLKEDAPFRDATTDEDRRSEADELIRFVKNFPRLAALKLQLGISF